MPKLLIVDDEVDIREFAKRFFSKRGIDVTTASNGEEALIAVEQHKPDLVLLDITMEKMSGVEALKKLRERNNQVKVIMVTGIEDEETVKQAKGYDVKGYIHKPLILEELEKVVMAELEKK